MPLALASALASVVLGLLLAAPGCLNPRPEEDPSVDSNESIEPDGNPSSPVRETCGDNPYLAGCEGPGYEQDDAEEGTPVNDGATPGASDPADAPADVGVGDAGAADAGAPADVTDAQAP